MERLPGELLLRIFHPLDHRSLAAARQVCRKWKAVASDDALWSNLFKERWGGDRATTSYAPNDSKSWKDVYIVQDRCHRFGVGTKIIREGSDYYLIHQGEIRRFLGTSQPIAGVEGRAARRDDEERASAISDRILFFLGDLETVCTAAKRVRM
ncbi:uncharacterized protein LOC122009826 [Zingiber officinale]|uniref:F-box protein n=1 Tax=Zingiber officinale TaxID=94328 RepID=A0A8J5FSC5_ZINOF|nr:uncharacterized protein LOC122009826 [Zingiber officinale]KAG6484661.1 hypothetical protein ZIOFF_053182 [Zingiber officinale]